MENYMKLMMMALIIYIMKDILKIMKFLVKELNIIEMAQKKLKEILMELIHIMEYIILQIKKLYLMVKFLKKFLLNQNN